MDFNPQDYISSRRISERQLGKAQPNYRTFGTAGRHKEQCDHAISDEVIENKNSSPALGSKRKNTSTSNSEPKNAPPAKRLRAAQMKSMAPVESKTLTKSSTRGKATPKRASARRSVPKKNKANVCSEKIPGVLSPPGTPIVSRLGDSQADDKSQDQAMSEVDISVPTVDSDASSDIAVSHKPVQEQVPTPESSRGHFRPATEEVERTEEATEQSTQDSLPPVVTKEAITVQLNYDLDTPEAAKYTDDKHVIQVEQTSGEIEFTSPIRQAQHLEDVVEELISDSTNLLALKPATGNFVIKPRDSPGETSVTSPIEQAQHRQASTEGVGKALTVSAAANPSEDSSTSLSGQYPRESRMIGPIEQSGTHTAVLQTTKSPEQQMKGKRITPAAQALQHDEVTSSIASSSGLSSPPSSIVTPQVYSIPATSTPSRNRPRRSIRPAHRYGTFVKTAAKGILDRGQEPQDPEGELKLELASEQQHQEVTVIEPDTDEDDIVRQQGGRKKGATKTLANAEKRRRKTGISNPKVAAPVSTHSPKLIVVLPVSLPMAPGPDTTTPKPSRRKANVASTSRSKAVRPRTSATSPTTGSPNDPNTYPELDSTIDPRVIELSLKLTKREAVQFKPCAKGEPEVWADSRQALCETVPYFKKPQGGCHQNDRHTYAFLFDNVGHCREYMDSDVIIARAGGSMESDGSTGRMIQKRDQLMSEAQVQSVINDIQLKNPLVIICGCRNQGAICRMPHRYNVLDWYKPINVWAEKTRGKGEKIWTTIKYRFERLGSATKAAWHETDSIQVSEEERQIAGPLTTQCCQHCQHRYPVVYLVGWMCLNQGCPRFWKVDGGEDAGYGRLHYNPAFLLHRTPWPVEEEPFSVRPPIPDVGKVVGDNLAQINTRGICCPRCGRCSSRRLFKGWKCDNAKCTYENFPAHVPVTIPMLHRPWESTGGGPALARNKHEEGVGVEVSYIHGFKVYTYTFDGIDGKFVHAVSNATINGQRGGADDMFMAMQNQDDAEMDMHLERRRFTVEKNAGDKMAAVEDEDAEKRAELEGDFMTAFSMNYGMPYKFVASGSSMPFSGAPWPIRACRADLNWASQTFLDKEKHVDLNEELIFAYMEGQKIEYHDDGESGLGPRITTLSLGGRAKMHVRMKMKHHVGCSKQGILTAERPVPGGIDGMEMYQKRLAAWNELQGLKDSNKPLYERRRREMPKELGVYEKRMKKAEDAVVVTLKHGDIVAMEGSEIQQYLEHKVVPEGPLRFALTCRTVLPEHLKAEELPSYEVEADDESMSSLRKMAAAQGEQQ